MISRIVEVDNDTADPGPEWRLLPASGKEAPASGRELMEDFLDSCGAGGPLRIDVTGPGPRQSVRCVFEQPCVMIGRDLGNDLRLDHDQVSRRHTYLQLLGGRIFCIDLGSRTGLWWGKRTRTAGWLDSPMHIGPYRLQLPDRLAAGLRDGLDWNPLETPAADQRVLPEVTLQVFDGGRPTLHTLDRVLTLAGRSTACKVQIANFSLSRYHCSFLLTASGVWVIDLLSREGTIVNGQRVKWACLRPGDQLELGRVLVCPHYEGDVPEGPTTMARAADDRFSPPPSSDPDLPAVAEHYAHEEDTSGRTLVAMPSAPQLPAVPSLDLKALEASGPQGALLVPVLQQFGLMQQQMMDQFQQSMQMVVQVFASMHRDQMGMLQQELDHIHRITKELNELQAEVRATRPGQPPPRRNGSHPRSSTPPAALPPSAPNGNSPQPKPDAAPAVRPVKSTPEAAAASAKTGPMPDMGDMHDWLNQRIVTLQKERESRWQKILGFVTGK
jgi:pSer/pThr/pTyr-binding forkhead associated (FHA) protein